jgi:hypothetical protein
MLYDWSRSESAPDKPALEFPFWSRMEIIRIGVVASLAIIPVSVAAVDAPKQKPATLVSESEAAAPPMQSGRLLSTRHVAFDVKALDLAAMGDAEPEKTR